MSEKMNDNIEEIEFETEIYSLVDEEGIEADFELIATYENNGNKYFALCPVEEEDSEEMSEYVILKVSVDEDGEEVLISIDDDDEFDAVADYFDDLFTTEIDYDA